MSAPSLLGLAIGGKRFCLRVSIFVYLYKGIITFLFNSSPHRPFFYQAHAIYRVPSSHCLVRILS